MANARDHSQHLLQSIDCNWRGLCNYSQDIYDENYMWNCVKNCKNGECKTITLIIKEQQCEEHIKYNK